MPSRHAMLLAVSLTTLAATGCKGRRIVIQTPSVTMVPDPPAVPTLPPVVPAAPQGLMPGAAPTGAVDVMADWTTTATAYRGQNARTLTVYCPPGTPGATIWGTDIYSDDSAICVAAMHAGRISPASGGVVTIQIQPGLAAYAGSARNGVSSTPYGSYAGSYTFVSAGSTVPAAPPPPPAPPGTTAIDWSANATSYRGRNGAVIAFYCPPGGTTGHTIWGTDVYTDDSAICVAAVHAGRINPASGGVVPVQIEPGLPLYGGTPRNGVTSTNYGSYAGSFGFVGGPRPVIPVAPPGTTLVGWGDNATRYRGQHGVVRLFCPPGGTSSTVWGSGVYTDDSSVCTAAVHAGRINAASGGVFAIEPRAGLSAYVGSVRNGVTTVSYGSFGGSFVVR